MAIGAVQAARARGLRLPADLSVVGFDDTSESLIVVPALTTVRQPLAELGRTAVSILLRQVENRRFEPLRVELETTLVVRDSTAALLARGSDPRTRCALSRRGLIAASAWLGRLGRLCWPGRAVSAWRRPLTPLVARCYVRAETIPGNSQILFRE